MRGAPDRRQKNSLKRPRGQLPPAKRKESERRPPAEESAEAERFHKPTTYIHHMLPQIRSMKQVGKTDNLSKSQARPSGPCRRSRCPRIPCSTALRRAYLKHLKRKNNRTQRKNGRNSHVGPLEACQVAPFRNNTRAPSVRGVSRTRGWFKFGNFRS